MCSYARVLSSSLVNIQRSHKICCPTETLTLSLIADLSTRAHSVCDSQAKCPGCPSYVCLVSLLMTSSFTVGTIDGRVIIKNGEPLALAVTIDSS